MSVVDRGSGRTRNWVCEAVRIIDADANRSADTHLLPFPLPTDWNVQLYLKDESTHPTGSLKHRLARSLFLYALCNGWITEGTTVIEASSGSTAVSEAYFARLLGLPFVAVMPRTTSCEKVALIERQGGTLPLRRRAERDVRGVAQAGRRARRALHGPVHPRRAGDRLAGQQQHRRVDLRADGARTQRRAGVGRRRRGHRRHQRHDRPVHPLPRPAHQARRRRPGELGVLRRVARQRPRPHRLPGLADRGDRAAAGGALVRRPGDRPDDQGARRGVHRGHPAGGAAAGPAGRRLDRHQPVGRLRDWSPSCARQAGRAAS